MSTMVLKSPWQLEHSQPSTRDQIPTLDLWASHQEEPSDSASRLDLEEGREDSEAGYQLSHSKQVKRQSSRESPCWRTSSPMESWLKEWPQLRGFKYCIQLWRSLTVSMTLCNATPQQPSHFSSWTSCYNMPRSLGQNWLRYWSLYVVWTTCIRSRRPELSSFLPTPNRTQLWSTLPQNWENPIQLRMIWRGRKLVVVGENFTPWGPCYQRDELHCLHK